MFPANLRRKLPHKTETNFLKLGLETKADSY